jgi:hypothetical protein
MTWTWGVELSFSACRKSIVKKRSALCKLEIAAGLSLTHLETIGTL